MAFINVKFSQTPRYLIIIILFGLSVYFFNDYLLSKQEKITMIENPLIHDVYIMDSEKLSEYVPSREKLIILQVTNVVDDNIHLKVSSYKYLRQRDAIKGIRSDKLLTRNYFSLKPLILDKKELKSLWHSEAIKEVGRPSGALLFGGAVIAKQRHVAKKKVYPLGHRDNQQAIAYYQGNMGFEQNWQEAFRLFKKAAEKGHQYAHINLAKMFLDGHGVEQNEDKALYWLRMAKESNFMPASEPYLKLCQKLNRCLGVNDISLPNHIY